MHTAGHRYILLYFLFQIMINKKHGQQNQKKVLNLQKEFYLRTIKVYRFEIIDCVKYVFCIKHAYKFLLREQVWFASVIWCLNCVNVFLVINCIYMRDTLFLVYKNKTIYLDWTNFRTLLLKDCNIDCINYHILLMIIRNNLEQTYNWRRNVRNKGRLCTTWSISLIHFLSQSLPASTTFVESSLVSSVEK